MKRFFSRHEEKENVPHQINTFSFALYRELKESGDSLFVSPFSISSCLAMVYGGAGGKTAKQIADVFGFPSDQNYLLEALGNLVKILSDDTQERAYQLLVANALWGQKGYRFSPKYVELLAVKYGSEVNEVDFETQPEAACQAINQWVQEKTQDKIKGIIQPDLLDPLTRLVLTNAVYFKGKWELPFDEYLTDLSPFKMRTGTSEITEVDVAMMKKNGWFTYMENEDFQAIEMPYEGRELSMAIFLPREIDGLPDFEASLTHENLSSWIQMLQPTDVEVSLPKFRLTSQFVMGELLQSMGMKDAFDQNTADFSGMTEPKDFWVSDVLHKTFVDVGEEGTEAAAVTGAIAGLAEPEVAPPPPPVFRADHPFFFLIRHIASGTILFMGRICDTVGLVQDTKNGI
ncbi:MAG: serpin family protein [Deltaproteobacteria bacterium]|nr:serpin family protein [Deltaproteobacteria bacterium]